LGSGRKIPHIDRLTGLHREPTPATTQPAPPTAVESPVIQEIYSRSSALETLYYGVCSGDEVLPKDSPLEIALTRFEYLEFVLFGVEPRGGSNEVDYELEANQALARIVAIECATRSIPRLSALELRFGLKGNGCGIFSRIGALNEKIVGKASDQPRAH
jgi:hypothetical protein